MSLGSAGEGQTRGLQLRRLQRERMRYKNNSLHLLLIHAISCRGWDWRLGRTGHTHCIRHGPEHVFPMAVNVSRDTTDRFVTG